MNYSAEILSANTKLLSIPSITSHCIHNMVCLLLKFLQLSEFFTICLLISFHLEFKQAHSISFSQLQSDNLNHCFCMTRPQRVGTRSHNIISQL